MSQTRGPYRITAEALLVGRDMILSIWGGSKPHVGAVALAVPRPSLKDPAVTGSTSSVLTRVGHKEDDMVKKISEKMSAALDSAVVVSAGIHWDDLSGRGIDTVNSLCETLADRLIARILEQKP